MRTGREGRKRSGSGVLCVGIGKKSKLSFIHRQLGHLLSVGGIVKKSGPSLADLNLSLNTLDSQFKAIEPPGQTVQKKQADLLEKPWGAMALRTHL
jgi:hypothetical protein